MDFKVCDALEMCMSVTLVIIQLPHGVVGQCVDCLINISLFVYY